MEPYRTMALNNAWANATFYAALSTLSDAVFVAERPGFFPSLAATMNHIHDVDLYYVDALEEGGAGRSVFERAPVTSARDLGALQAAVDLRFARFCASIGPDDLTRPVATERRDDPQATEQIGALILHLVQHQIHHRGQAHVQLQVAGVSPPQLDDFYLDYGRVPSAQAYFAEGG